MTPSRDIGRLLEIMAALRTPETGCPWDLAQNFSTIAPYTLEEAYEVADAIARDDMADLKEELGDLLLQVVYHARMAEERGAFAFGDVVQAITEKMIRRHPHVFGDMAGELQAYGLQSRPQAVEGLWERIKTQEKQDKAAGSNAGAAEWRARRRTADAPCPDTRAKTSSQSQQGRLRLERSARRIAQDPGRSRRDRSRARSQARRSRGRGRRFVVCRRQSRAPSARRSGSGVARRPTANSSAALPSIEAGPGRPRQDAAGVNARRDGRAVGRGQNAANDALLFQSGPAARGSQSAISGKTSPQ